MPSTVDALVVNQYNDHGEQQYLSPQRTEAIQNTLETAWMKAHLTENDQAWHGAVLCVINAIQTRKYGSISVAHADSRETRVDFSQIRMGVHHYDASISLFSESGAGSLHVRCRDDGRAVDCNVSWARITPLSILPSFASLPREQRDFVTNLKSKTSLREQTSLRPTGHWTNADGSTTHEFHGILEPASEREWYIALRYQSLSRATDIEARSGTDVIACRIPWDGPGCAASA